MPHLDNPLVDGRVGRVSYAETARRVGVLVRLARFAPQIVGTPPLGIDIATSDIDIVCHADDTAVFATVVACSFSEFNDFAIRQWIREPRSVIATFVAEGWRFEIFGDSRPLKEQPAYRHFLVERRLLRLGGRLLKRAVMEARAGGLKTEPAFAHVLQLSGDPYEAILALQRETDACLLQRLMHWQDRNHGHTGI